jgi:hypothetical protein
MNPAATSTESPGAYEVWVDFFDDAYRELYAGLLDPVRTEVEVAATRCRCSGAGCGSPESISRSR